MIFEFFKSSTRQNSSVIGTILSCKMITFIPSTSQKWISMSVCSGLSHSSHSLSLQMRSHRHHRTWRHKSVCLSHTHCANVQPEKEKTKTIMRYGLVVFFFFLFFFVLWPMTLWTLPQRCCSLESLTGARPWPESPQQQTEANTRN